MNNVVGVVGSAQRINEKATAIGIMKYKLIVVNIEEFPFQRRLRGFNRSLSDCDRFDHASSLRGTAPAANL